MTVRQVIAEIEALPPEQQREVFLHLKEQAAAYSATSSDVRYLDRETARPLIKEMLSEHSELFRKLSL